ncbi:hypothetical protein DYBT9275_04183 [Dyadobacter sp. CECT 9275]|uniref:DUF4136 domain-containing protein n=1 Tax=Dyadobacter helix TaxID=2822344 RepID=A0A916N628_9BACT|nr:DUF4136 domain-containing protein [Dyadobacter sp. CECT 9275]CAG5008050.1 hypothetical protein DYBT9275_04183 [Dyadobacter sp. CECT 9275]
MKTLACVLIGLFLISGCNPGYKILKSQSEPGFRLSGYSTFGFYEIEASGDTIPASFERNITIIKTAISKNLQKLGLNEARDPALKINIALLVQEKSQTRQTDFRTDGLPRYMGQRRYSWKSEEVVIEKYRQGTMLIDLVNAADNQMVWKGGSEGIIPDKQDLEADINQMVDKIFEKIPH